MYIRAIPKYILPGISYGGRLVAFRVWGKGHIFGGLVNGEAYFLLPYI